MKFLENPIAQKTLWILGLTGGASALGIGTWALTRKSAAAAAVPASAPAPYVPPAPAPSADNTTVTGTIAPDNGDLAASGGGDFTTGGG